jgi:hypothetical protein
MMGKKGGELRWRDNGKLGLLQHNNIKMRRQKFHENGSAFFMITQASDIPRTDNIGSIHGGTGTATSSGSGTTSRWLDFTLFLRAYPGLPAPWPGTSQVAATRLWKGSN